jgi:hypothetical protein
LYPPPPTRTMGGARRERSGLRPERHCFTPVSLRLHVQLEPSLSCKTSVDWPANPVDVKVQSAVSFADPAGLPLESVTLMLHCAWSEHPLDVAGHDPWRLGKATSWSGPGPVTVTVPVPPVGSTQLPALDDDTVSLSE